MPVNSVLSPYAVFLDAAGVPLENGFIYIGTAGFEARTTPKASFWDAALTIPTGTASGAAVRTKAGLPVNTSNAPAMFYADGDYSISVCDKNGVLLYSALNNTLAINVGATGPALGTDGNLAAVGIGFINEPDTGFVRSATDTMQTVVGGVLVSQQTPTGTAFSQPVSGAGFSTGVTTEIGVNLAAIRALGTNGILARTGSGAVAARTITAGAGVTVTNGDGVAGNPTISTGWTYTAPVSLTGLATNDWTGIPAGVTEVKVFLSLVSLSGTNNIDVLLGTSGGMVATGYYSLTSTVDGTAVATSSSTVSFLLFAGIAADAMSGFLTFLKGDSNKWFLSATVARGGAKMTIASGEVDLGAALTQLRVKAAGANTFDGSSSAYIAYR